MSSLIEKLNNDRKSLLQLDGTNPLLNFKPFKAKGIEFVHNDSVSLLSHLLQLKSVEFIGKEQESLFPKTNPVIPTNLNARKWKIQCDNYDHKAVSNRLAKTFKEAETHIEEKGVNILFLSIGMVKWREADVSEKFWRSPLILIPVEMNKTKKFDEEGNDIYEIGYNEEEIEENHSLKAAFKDRFGIEFPSMPNWLNIEDEKEIEVAYNKWISKIRVIISNKKEWELQTDNHALSFFAFTKFFMYKDLDPIKWFKDNVDPQLSLFKKVVDEGFGRGETLYGEEYNLDENLNPDKPVTVLDLDSSQAKVILEVQSGQSLVVEGPPGTGKSQTIANLLADAVYHGKKVLFVAEKMVALQVVKRRLEAVGLGPSCLELHGAKAKKSEFVKDLKSTLLNPVKASLPGVFNINDLKKNRDELRKWSNAVNDKAKNGYSPFDLMGLLLWVKEEMAGTSLPERKLALYDSWEEFKIYADTLSKLTVGDSRHLGNETQSIQILDKLLLDIGTPAENPFIGCELQDIPLQSKEHEIKTALISCKGTIQKLDQQLLEFTSSLSIEVTRSFVETNKLIETFNLYIQRPHPSISQKIDMSWLKDADKINLLIEQVIDIQNHKAELLKLISSELVLNENLIETRKFLASIKDNIWNRIFNSDLKKSKLVVIGLLKDPMQKKNISLLSICDNIITYQEKLSILTEFESLGNTYFGELWLNEKSDCTLLKTCFSWCSKYHSLLSIGVVSNKMSILCKKEVAIEKVKVINEKLSYVYFESVKNIKEIQSTLTISPSQLEHLYQMDFPQLILRLQGMNDNFSQLAKWILFHNHCSFLKNNKKGLFVEMAYNWHEAKNKITRYFQLLVWEQMLENAFSQNPILKQKNGHSLYESCNTFKEIDNQLKSFYKAELINKHTDSIAGLGSAGQAGYLRENVQRQRKIPAIRTFLKESLDAIIAIKPIFMMSPLSVASYLEAIPEMFDIVIFDEASQVEPVDSYGAIMRGKQLVVVGDTKQMPPSQFFKKMVNEDEQDEDIIDDLASSVDSIMEIMLAKNAPSKLLQWHYRSKHQSLIAVSNKCFYESRLLIYPSTRLPGDMLGLKMHISNYKSYPYELKGINSNEADLVANAVMDFAEKYPNLSLGVVAFNVNQSDLIDKKIKELAIQNSRLSEFINRNSFEPFFVKNLERVQGDERDVIFISIGYGKTVQGVFGHQMGPLNKQGGERRLNVLITRAKLANHIFCNFSSDEIDLNRTNAFGVKVLKDFLHYAEKGVLHNEELTGLEPDSEFEIQVANELRKLNYDVEHQVGSVGYRIDLAVKHPEKKGLFVLGIECDGATYHSSKSARDRDRLRQSVLESFGWNIYRIWSTDWFLNKTESIQRIHTYLQTAITAFDSEVKEDEPQSHNGNDPAIIINPVSISSQKSFTPYKLVDTSEWRRQFDVLAMQTSVLQRYILQIVEAESPIHQEHVCKRIVEYQFTSLGSRIRSYIETNISSLIQSRQIIGHKEILWFKEIKINNPRDFSFYPKKDIDFIATEELELAISIVIKDSISISKDELIAETARRLGFRATSAVQSKLNTIIKKMQREDQMETIDGLIRIKTI